MSQHIGSNVATSADVTPAPEAPALAIKPQEGDVDSAADQGSQKVAGGSTLGDEGWIAVDSVNGTTVEESTAPDPTRPSDEQILTFENELRYCFLIVSLHVLSASLLFLR
jgi:hypothetical protein